MASLVTRKSGSRFVQFIDRHGGRKTITLGTIAPREAGRIRDKIEELASTQRNGVEPSPEAAHWLVKIGDELHDKLAGAGLVEPRKAAPTLSELVTDYVAGRTDWKARSRVNFEQATRQLRKHFGDDRPCDGITEAEALTFAADLRKSFASATAIRNIKRCKQLFSFATKAKYITSSPFAEIKAGKSRGSSADRRHFVTREEVATVLNACPDNEWRLLVALSRFGGLRIPSEGLALKWGDIKWERNRMIVPVPKLEHLGERHATRVVPIFPELRTYLEAAWDEAELGAEFVITRYCDKYTNLGTQLGRIVRQAALKPWPKLWHNMRASRETELSASFPLHVVCSWIGNSIDVAQEHYLTVTEQDFTKAVSLTTNNTCSAQLGAQQYGAESAGKASQPKSETPQSSEENEGLRLGANDPLPPRGFEPLFSD